MPNESKPKPLMGLDLDYQEYIEDLKLVHEYCNQKDLRIVDNIQIMAALIRDIATLRNSISRTHCDVQDIQDMLDIPSDRM